jgi:hypothetical protein
MLPNQLLGRSTYAINNLPHRQWFGFFENRMLNNLLPKELYISDEIGIHSRHDPVLRVMNAEMKTTR